MIYLEAMTSHSSPVSEGHLPAGLSDPLSSALWQARASVTPLRRAAWPVVSAERGEAVAAELYAALRAGGAALRGAKLGATDEPSQRSLGATGPLIAPIHDSTALEDGATISLADLIVPRLEPEVGIRVEDGEVLVVPCIEIIDSSWSWDATIGHLTADFGGQARMMFGAAVPPPPQVDVVVRHDDRQEAAGGRELEQVLPALARARAAIGELDELPVALVATGTIVPAIPLTAGRWVVDFGALGTLELTAED
jgi:2-keto-4-pentenoate hydratase